MKIKQQIVGSDGNSKIIERDLTEQEILEKDLESERISRGQKLYEINKRLDELKFDFTQVFAGAIIPNLEERKAEFERLHNEQRALLGKPAREYVKSDKDVNKDF